MRRKVNKVGQNTLTLSLPNKWVKEQNIKKGDELEVKINQNQLCISKDEETALPQKEISINLTEADKTIVRSILGAYYQKGYDLIRVTFEDDKIFKAIKEAVNTLIGFEIVDRTSNNCVIKSYLMEAPEELSNVMNKLINITKTLQQMVKEDYINGKYERLEDIEEYRFSGWKLRDLSMRIISKKNISRESKHEYLTLLWTLEKINRNYKRLYCALKDNNFKKNQKILVYYDKVSEFYDFFSRCLLKKDVKNSEHINKEHDKLVKEAFEILEGLKKDSIIMTYLLENVRRMQDMASPIVMINY